MNKSFWVAALIAVLTSKCAVAEEKPRITYVGDGRYACSGSTSACAQVDANNRQREQIRQFEADRQRYETERYNQEIRRRQMENKYGR